MKKGYGLMLLTIATGLFLGGCSAKKETSPTAAGAQETPPAIEVRPLIKGGADVYAIPNATAFRMSGDYADNVAITLREDGTLLYYPAPSDLTAQSAPYPLGSGWYLNRQGLGNGSVFTSYTFAEYMALPQAPSQEELLKAVIPGAVVTEIIELPITAADAAADPAKAAALLPQ